MKRILKTLLAVSFILTFGESLFGPIYAIFVKNIGGDILDAGFAFALFSIASGIFVFTLGRSHFFTAHLRKMVFYGALIITIGTFGYLFVSTPLELFVVQIIIGFGNGFLEPSWDGLFSTDLNERAATSFWSLWAGGKDILIGLASILGAAIVAVSSFSVLFWIMGCFGVISTVAAAQLLSPKNKW
jgi:hypothetical protein